MSRYHYRALRRLRNASRVPTDKITARFAKAKPYDRYIELTKSFVELRGSDPDSNNKAIPRILVSDARLIIDLYTKAWKRNIWKVIRAAHKERELERFQATIDQLKGCKQDERDVYEQFSSCINCLLCYAACPQYGLNPEFVGPGIMALLHRYNTDSRDGGAAQRMDLVHSEAGVFNCTAVGYCSEVCPKQVDPANAVNINKTESAMDYFLRFVAPRGSAAGGAAK